VRKHRDHLVPVLTYKPASKTGADPMRKQERLDFAHGRDFAPGRDRTLDGFRRDRPPRPSPHLTQPLWLSVELAEHFVDAEVVDDRACERRTDAGHARDQPAHDPVCRLR